MKQCITIGFAPKTTRIPDGRYLHFWYANNRGRGDSNCTVILSTDAQRAPVSRNQPEVVARTLTSAWAGRVNLSTRVLRELGL